MTDLEKLVTRITDCATRVHENMGPGFPEKIYQEAMIKEMTRCKVNYTLSLIHI
jgi:GxxExxY protein